MKLFHVILFLFLSLSVSAQSRLLDKKIDLQITEKPLEEALDLLSKEGQFFFSYNAELLDLESNIRVDAKQTPIKSILDQLLKNPQIQYKEIGNHIILTQKKLDKVDLALPPKKASKPKFIILSGYIVDSLSKKVLAHASIYEHNQNLAAVSDEYGYYELKLGRSDQAYQLSVSHRFYQEKSYTFSLKENGSFTPHLLPRLIERMEITPKLLAQSAEINPIQDVFLVRHFVKAEILFHPLKKDSFETRLAQFSFLPHLNTSGSAALHKRNKFSLNFLAGYASGLRGVEIGGIMNIDRNEVYGLQLAGLGNVVGGNTGGLQIAGGFNVNRASVKGVQLAGINNWADSLIGGQFSPVNNYLKGKLAGIQLSAISNISQGEINGIQAGGILNLGKSLDGAQIAGIGNFTSKEFSGAQVATIFNKARKGKGIQLGLINVCDSLDGVPIGLINIIKRGYRGIELGGGISLPTSIKLKTGNHSLYSIIALGWRPGDYGIWGYALGLGNALKTSKKMYLHNELLVWHIHQDEQFITGFNHLLQFQASLHRSLSPKFALSLGPTLNFHLSNYKDEQDGTPLSSLHPYNTQTRLAENSSNLFQFWLGGQIGLTLW